MVEDCLEVLLCTVFVARLENRPGPVAVDKVRAPRDYTVRLRLLPAPPVRVERAADEHGAEEQPAAISGAR